MMTIPGAAPMIATALEALAPAAATRLHLSPRSPDFDPIEQALAKLKALLCEAACRTVPGFVGCLRLDAFTADERRPLFRNTTHDCDQIESVPGHL